MPAKIQEVANSMSPKGILIGNASEVQLESPDLSSGCMYSSSFGRGIGLPLSPSHPLTFEDLSADDALCSPAPLDLDHPKDSRVEQYTSKLNLTEVVMKHLSEPKRRLVDVLSDYDEEKLGLLSISSLKKCLHCHSIDLTSSEFRLVFDGCALQSLPLTL